MNLARNHADQLLDLLHALPTGEFCVRDVFPLGARLHMKQMAVYKALSALEKADKLVRMRHGLYLTMREYLRRGYKAPEVASLPPFWSVSRLREGHKVPEG